MIIVFFHVLYLIGKMVYKNFQSTRIKETSENGEKSCSAGEYHDNILEPYDDDDDCPQGPRFSPPAYIQRYHAVSKVLQDPRYEKKIKKVVDFGCSEMGFLTYLKHTNTIEEILCVDVDRDTLNVNKYKAVPLNSDFLVNRPNPLTVSVYEGSVTQRDKRLANTDAVVAIELIEHLHPETLMDFPYNVFGYVKPLVAIITTPNADFNVLFPMKTKFRHWDHKFEWTREQFEDWANNIVSRYPEYDVSFEGICPGPPGTENLGCCSQMAIFRRVRVPKIEPIFGIEDVFKTVTMQKYPYTVDNRSDEQKILDEASYHIGRFTHINPEGLEEYPLSSLLENLSSGQFFTSADSLREILSNNGWTIEDRNDGPVILCPALSTFSDYEEDFLDDIDDGHNDFAELDEFAEHETPEASGTWTRDNIEHNYEQDWNDDYDDHGEIRTDYDTVNAFDNVEIFHDDEANRSSVYSVESYISEITNDSNVASSLSSVEHEPFTTFTEINESHNDPDMLENLSHHASSVDDEKDIAEMKSQSQGIKLLYKPEVSLDHGDSEELTSLCSIYLESSRNEQSTSCPENITNPSFDCASLEATFNDSTELNPLIPEKIVETAKIQSNQERLSTMSLQRVENNEEPNFSSSPRLTVAFCETADAQRNNEEDMDIAKSISQSSLRSNDDSSSIGTTTSSSTSFRTVKRWYPTEANDIYRKIDTVTLKGGSESADVPRDEAETSNDPTDNIFDDTRNLHVTRLERQKTPASLSLRSTTSSHERVHSNREQGECSASEVMRNSLEENTLGSKPQSSGGKIEDDEIIEIKTATPETPPNSWSPEIMDSGYPNSSSMQDMTPEYDLSSIAHDRISDSESPSVEDDAPRPPGYHELPEVENGDLANNNRDDEGNNVMAIDNDIEEDLQPLIDVLENDIENENDIYALENGFPMWLLRILERGNAAAGRRAIPAERLGQIDMRRQPYADVHAAGDAGIPDLDEGFDSTSSENDDSEDDDDDDEDEEEEEEEEEDEDDDENFEEVSTESSEEVVNLNNISGDHC